MAILLKNAALISGLEILQFDWLPGDTEALGEQTTPAALDLATPPQ